MEEKHKKKIKENYKNKKQTQKERKKKANIYITEKKHQD
jgi:hypothetical protein